MYNQVKNATLVHGNQKNKVDKYDAILLKCPEKVYYFT